MTTQVQTPTKVEFQFHPAQIEITSDMHRFRVVNCGRRFGKTILACYEMLAVAVHHDDARVAYIAPNYQQARDIAWKELKKICGPIAVKVNESRLEIIIKNNHGTTSTIFLRGWESVETLRGQYFHFLVIDEIAQFREFWSGWLEVLLPTLTDKTGRALFLSTPKGFNHFYDLYNKETTDSDFRSFHYSSYDNPHLPAKTIEKFRKSMTEDSFSQEYMADFRKTEGLVYKEFERDRHVVPVDDVEKTLEKEFKDTICGVDWGFKNPAAAIQIKVDGDNNYYITDEWYNTGKTTKQIIQAVKKMQPNEVYPDSAEPDRILEMQEEGLNTREVIKDIEYGIDVVRELFKANRIFIFPQCVNIINELETYSYPEKKPGRNEQEKPIKEHDHAMDAFRYALVTYNPIEDIAEEGGDFNLYGQSYT